LDPGAAFASRGITFDPDSHGWDPVTPRYSSVALKTQRRPVIVVRSVPIPASGEPGPDVGRRQTAGGSKTPE